MNRAAMLNRFDKLRASLELGTLNEWNQMRRIVVHIDSLVLKGFRYEDRHAIAAALQEELTRTLTAPGAAHNLASLGSVPRLRLGKVNLGAETKPHQVGAETGRAVGRGLLK